MCIKQTRAGLGEIRSLFSAPNNCKGTYMPSVLGVNITASNYDEVVRKCTEWAEARESRTVVFADAHVIMQAHDKPSFRADMNAADLANPDGMPIVWACRAFGAPDASRVYGPDATLALLATAQKTGLPVGFYGGNESDSCKATCRSRKTIPRNQHRFPHVAPIPPVDGG